jgi:hypothetical protein
MHAAFDIIEMKDTNIEDEYDFIEVIAQGDFSSVVKAVRKRDNEVFAIKIFQK